MDLPPKEPPALNTWAETRNPHPTDTMLRQHGFRIHGRPKHGVSLWRRSGVVFTQDEALEIAAEEVTGNSCQSPKPTGKKAK